MLLPAYSLPIHFAGLRQSSLDTSYLPLVLIVQSIRVHPLESLKSPVKLPLFHLKPDPLNIVRTKSMPALEERPLYVKASSCVIDFSLYI